MHIADGILSAPVLAGGAALALAGTAIGLRRVEPDQLPRMAMLAAAFFVASLIHLPAGPGQVHLLLSGLMGLVLGWGAFPALLTALLLQSFFFGYGGITALGVNTFNMALPAVCCWYLFPPLLRRPLSPRRLFLVGMAAGALAILLDTLLLAVALILSDAAYAGAVPLIFLTQLPVLLIEGLLTGSVLLFLRKVDPELLNLGDNTHGPF